MDVHKDVFKDVLNLPAQGGLRRMDTKRVHSSRTNELECLTSLTLDKGLFDPFGIGALIDAALCY